MKHLEQELERRKACRGAAELIDRLKNGTHKEEEERQTSQYMEGGIRDSTQRRNIKDEERFDPELWKEKINMSLGC
jgi:hypothetical protein